MNTPRPRLTPETLNAIRENYHDLAKQWDMDISSSVIEEHIKFMNICWEYLGESGDLETYLQEKSYLLQRKIKSGHEELDYEKKETREKIVSGEYLLGFLLDEDLNPEYTIIATKSSLQKMIVKFAQQFWESVSRPVNNGI